MRRLRNKVIDACMQGKTRLLLIKCIYEELVEVMKGDLVVVVKGKESRRGQPCMVH